MRLNQKMIANIYFEDRICRSVVYECDVDTGFETALREICYLLNTPTPVILRRHARQYADFNFTRFLPDDFVEAVDFDSLHIENAYKVEHDHSFDDY